MILSAAERQYERENIAKLALEAALSSLCQNEIETAKKVLERALLMIGFLSEGDDIPDWVLDAPDILEHKI